MNSARIFGPSTPSLSVVVPVYNSEGSLGPLVERLDSVLRSIGSEFEIILVNDGSRDRSWQVVTTLASGRPFIRGFDLMRNYGQHNALLLGIRAARHEVVITIDDDLQHPPEEIPKLIALLAEGYDVVYGRPQKAMHGLVRNLASRITKVVLQRSMGAETACNVSAFRALRVSVRDAFADYRGQFVSIDVLLTWGTTRFTSVKVLHDRRVYGASNYNYRKLVIHALNMVTGYSVVPLQVASGIGFLLTLLGIVLFLYVVSIKLVYDSPVEGFTFLAAMVALFSGAQLFALGMMGEYLARMHFRMMDMPTYTVRSAVGDADQPSSSSR
jgi:glycosyltransferase involved in cell wall biosynthesis